MLRKRRPPRMRQDDWEKLYSGILVDFGYSRLEDEASARLLAAIMANADLIDEDETSLFFKREVTVFGPAYDGHLSRDSFPGTLISAGDATALLVKARIYPDVIVTDLDGDIRSQKEASSRGALTFIHAHGDNADRIMEHAKDFRGPVVLTAQSGPFGPVVNYGGFTDGDRAVCIARHFGASMIYLAGFDLSSPVAKEGSDPVVKAKKLRWAERIIGLDSDDIIII